MSGVYILSLGRSSCTLQKLNVLSCTPLGTWARQRHSALMFLLEPLDLGKAIKDGCKEETNSLQHHTENLVALSSAVVIHDFVVVVVTL